MGGLIKANQDKLDEQKQQIQSNLDSISKQSEQLKEAKAGRDKLEVEIGATNKTVAEV